MARFWEEEIKRASGIFRLNKQVNVIEIQPFCLEEIRKLKKDDIIVEIDCDEILFLKPTSIYFKNNCHVLGHNLIGTIYANGSHFFEENFEGFTCIILDGRIIIDETKEEKYTRQFILKCKKSRYSQDIKVSDEWISFIENN